MRSLSAHLESGRTPRVLALGFVPVLAFALNLVWGATAHAGDGVGNGDAVGLSDLIKRIGLENLPDGFDIRVGQVEGTADGNNYGPNQGNPDFSDKTFIAESAGDPGVSGHATSVGLDYYGNTISVAPGITTIHLFDAFGWITDDYLRTQVGPSAIQPFFPPSGLKIFNNSWVADLTPNSADNDCIRRADFVVSRDNVLIVNGVNNVGGTNDPLMSHMYNGIAVGVESGGHVSDETANGVDGPGRLKPEIVAPGNATSFATPIVSACGALLVDVARSEPLDDNPNAERTEILKAVLLAGASHRESWTNNPETSGPNRGVTSQPIDTVFGADTVNINTSHMILTGEETNAPGSPPSSANIGHAGWDLATLAPSGGATYYRFSIAKPADEVSIIATWHRKLNSNFSASSVANINLELFRVGKGGRLQSLVGDAGLPHFDDGNIVSNSSIDNVEHLFIRGLEPGEYTLRVQRVDGLAAFPGWDVGVAWLMPEQPAVACAADVAPPGSGDGIVGPADLGQLLSQWGPCPGCPEDIFPVGAGDDVVGAGDLGSLLANWGQCE
jgi:hypothetical protein